MFILTQPIQIYSTKLITDMVGRYAQTEDSVCPMYGYIKRLQELWHTDETTADICALFEEQPDFDADKATPTVTLEDLEGREDSDLRVLQQEKYVDFIYDPYKHKTDFDGYVRHLEKLPEGYMDTYLDNIVYRIRKQNSSLAVYNRRHPIQNNYVSVGDNGLDITERVDLVADYNIDRSQLQDVENARIQLPYVVKRLHNLSRICRIHILSFIASYLIAKDRSDKARFSGTSTSQFKLNDVIRVGVWKCDTNGDVIDRVSLGDKNKNAPVVFQWAMGYPTVFSSYHDDMINFITYCEALSIDILNDKLWTYGSEFVSSLFVPIVTSNNQYDKLVSDAIRFYGNDIDKHDDSLIKDDFSQTLMEVITNYQSSYFERPDEYNEYMKQDEAARNYIFKTATDLAIYQNSMYKMSYRPKSAFSWISGLLHMDGSLFLFVTSLIDPSFAGKDSYCVISDTGYLIRVEASQHLYRVKMNSLINHICKLQKGEVKAPHWEVL